MAEALRMVKAELGPDAMILSTKKEKTGGILGFFSKQAYRVTAAIDPARKPAPPPPAPAVYREPPPRERTAREELENSMLAPLARELKDLREKVESLTRREEDARKEEKPADGAQAAPQQEGGINLKNIPRSDLEEIKKLLLATLTKSQEGGVKNVQWPTADGDPLPETASGEQLLPEDSPLSKELARNGVSTDLIRKIIDTLNTLPPQGESQSVNARLGETLGRLIKFAGNLRLKKNSPRIMGIPLEVASTPAELEKAVKKHSACDLIFIDTAGRSHKDKEKLDEMKSFFENKITVEVYLCLSATTKDRELEEILQRFSIFPISKVVFTKIDESESLGNMVNLLMKDNLSIAYFTTGQRVPEDIEIATPAKLADMILREEAQ